MSAALSAAKTSPLHGGAAAFAAGSTPPEAQRRREALADFERVGLPNRRVEEWKYTDLRALMREVLPPAEKPGRAARDRAAHALDAYAIEGVRRLVIVDGTFVAELSDRDALEPGLRIDALAADGSDDSDGSPDSERDAMAALNLAMASDGLSIAVAAGTTLERPLHVVHVATATTPSSMFFRSVLRLGRGASATMVQSYIAANGASTYQVHDGLAVTLDEEARLDHVRLVEDARDAFNITSGDIRLAGRAHLNFFALTSGASVSRYQATIRLGGEGGRVNANGVNLLVGRQHADTTLVLDHAAAHCDSREVFRAVLDDAAHSVFQGRIIVRPDAQKTDAKMMTRALLLSDDAEADNKPELVIFADDVTCGHGATTGALDDSLLFYLRARGLSEKQAQALLIQAFIGEAIESIADDRLRDLVIAAGERWLAARE